MLTIAPEQRRTEGPSVDHRGSRDRPVLLPAATVTFGAALAILVGRDGSPAWQGARVVATVAVGAVAVVGLRRWSRWAAGATAFGLGLVGTAVGIGIGGPHVAKDAAVLPTLAGLTCLVSGLILVIGGAVALLGIVPGWWRRTPVVVALVAVAYPLVSSLAIAVAATNVPPTSVGRPTPADLGLTYRDVEFPATDGVALSGWYLAGDNGAAVVVLHGAGSTRSGVLDHAAVLAGHGYGVLLFDARGHGRSAGRAMDFGWYGDRDVGAAVSFLAAQPGVHAIAAVGMSMGGEQAIGAAASDRRIGAVVAEGATNRVAGDREWLPDVYGIRGWLQRPVDWLTYGAADLLTDAPPPITLRRAAATSASPMMLITAGDVDGEANAARHIAAAAPARVEIWDVPGTGHTDALRTRPEEWEERVIAFIADALAVSER